MPSRGERRSTPANARDALAVVQHLYAVAMDPAASLWDAVISDLADFFSVEVASGTAVDKATGRVSVLGLVGFDRHIVESAYRRFGVESDPLFAAATRQPANATFRDGVVLPPEDMVRSPYYNMLPRPTAIDRHLCGILRNDAGAFMAVVFWRPGDSDGFTPQEEETLGWLMPHIRQAAEIRERVAAANAGVKAAPVDAGVGFLDDPRRGAVVLDAEGRVLLTNGPASRMAAPGGCIEVVRNRLTAADPALRQALERARLATLQPRPSVHPPILRAPRVGGGLPCEIQMLPASSRPDAGLLPPGAATVVLLTDPVSFFRPSRQRLRALGLTIAEARLCEALLRSGSLPRAAAETGIAHGTARSHLKAIFAKLGVSSQIELVQALVSGYPGDGTPTD